MKNLNEEYKKSQQEETPDLWDRIEKNLPEKKQGRLISINRYLAVAAAALFLCAMLPGVWYLAGGDFPDGNGKSDSAAPMQMADYAQAEDCVQAEDSTQSENNIQSGSIAEDNDREDVVMADAMPDSAEGAPIEDCLDATGQIGSEQDFVTESFEVTGSMEVEDQTVYLLCGQDGNVLRAILVDPGEQELQIGEIYLCSLRKVEGEGWEYEILEIE